MVWVDFSHKIEKLAIKNIFGYISDLVQTSLFKQNYTEIILK